MSFLGAARKSAFLNAAQATADQSVVAAVAGKEIHVLTLILTGPSTATAFFESATSTAISATFTPNVNVSDEGPLFKTVAGQALTVTTAGTGIVGTHIVYGLVAA